MTFGRVNLLESCVESMQKYNADIVWFSWKTFYDGLANPESCAIMMGILEQIKNSLSL